MGKYDSSQAVTTSLTNNIDDFSVDNEQLDQAQGDSETYYDFPDASTHLSYYKNIPELKSAVDNLDVWTTSKGVETDARTRVLLERLSGMGNETFLAIISNLFRQSLIYGDSFAEIIRDDRGQILNLKPLHTGNMRIVVNAKGIIIRYEQLDNTSNHVQQKFQPQDIFHLTNDRIGNEIHGISVIDQVKWIIDARNEAMQDWRRISHRSTIRVMYVDFENSTELNALKSNYKEAIQYGEVLILPAKKGEIDLEDVTLPPIDAFLRWIQYLENAFYQAVGVPRVIATSENYTEAASKVGYITFEPVYTKRQTALEAAMWAQLALKVKFNRPPSLTGVVSESERKNTGQLGIQPNEVNATAGRVE